MLLQVLAFHPLSESVPFRIMNVVRRCDLSKWVYLHTCQAKTPNLNRSAAICCFCPGLAGKQRLLDLGLNSKSLEWVAFRLEKSFTEPRLA